MAMAEPTPIQTTPSPSALFSCTTPDSGRIELRGELDADSAPALSVALLRLCHSEHPTITVDLSAVTFMGAAGLTVLLHIHNLMNIDDRTLILHRPSRVVRRILEVTGLDMILPITSEVE